MSDRYSPTEQPAASSLAEIAPLGDPVRRGIYLCLEASPSGMTRKEIAAALAIPTELARFHLDRLQNTGMVAASRCNNDHSASGRPAKVYTVARRVAVSVPPRRYEMLGRILINLMRDAGAGSPASRAAASAARRAGRELAAGPASGSAGADALMAILTEV